MSEIQPGPADCALWASLSSDGRDCYCGRSLRSSDQASSSSVAVSAGCELIGMWTKKTGLECARQLSRGVMNLLWQSVYFCYQGAEDSRMQCKYWKFASIRRFLGSKMRQMHILWNPGLVHRKAVQTLLLPAHLLLFSFNKIICMQPSIREIPYHLSSRLSQGQTPEKLTACVSLPLPKHLLWAALRDDTDEPVWQLLSSCAQRTGSACPAVPHYYCIVQPPAEKYFTNWQSTV